MAKAKLIHLTDDPTEIAEYYLRDKREVVVGRGIHADLEPPIPDNPFTIGISRSHCMIYKSANNYFIEDRGNEGNGSTNGTYLNKRKLTIGNRLPLNHNDEIRLGTLYTVRFLIDDKSAGPALDKEYRIDESQASKTLDEEAGPGGSATAFDFEKDLKDFEKRRWG
ncbi:MAG: FHA domain-containing protein [Planctomycetota bacterium]|jgi:pSer/pThr/pTyr-binding forkhead associated (FHA) protein